MEVQLGAQCLSVGHSTQMVQFSKKSHLLYRVGYLITGVESNYSIQGMDGPTKSIPLEGHDFVSRQCISRHQPCH